ncbi:hypothetical protein PAXRUDRAFT_825615 [Paxillus rubicundulus Ve08.2h10]|uniref:Uncharacterized protein n=1 Tax=Paxillus rubicundulus Ve08.2h10 TaxID=930991 RepID=A0A0D0EAN5_9AGAM|nr:hypothetical protein PAXRUDRAFT_825615 [Paxillus rubicundulus Ve08.2h10]
MTHNKAVDCPANMNGERSLALSEKCANIKMTTTYQDVRLPSSEKGLDLLLAGERIRRNSQQLTEGRVVFETAGGQ